MTRLCVGALFCTVGGEHRHLGLVCFLGGVSDNVVDELLSSCRQRRGLPVLLSLAIMAMGTLALPCVLLVPSMQVFRRDSHSDVLFLVPLLHWLLCGELVIVISLVLV